MIGATATLSCTTAGAFLADERAPSPVVVDVFSRLRRSDDALPATVLEPRLACELLGGGECRLLRRDLGEERLRLYAATVKDGRLALSLVGDRGVVISVARWAISWVDRGEGKVVRAFGFVADGVERVEVALAGRSYDAFVENNGFFFETRDHRHDEIEGLRLHFWEGRVEAV